MQRHLRGVAVATGLAAGEDREAPREALPRGEGVALTRDLLDEWVRKLS